MSNLPHHSAQNSVLTPTLKGCAIPRPSFEAVRFATPDSLDAYLNRQPLKVTLVTEEGALEESFFLGLRLNRGVDLDRVSAQFGDGGIAVSRSAIAGCIQDGLLEKQGSSVRLTARGRLLSNEVFARFLNEKQTAGTGCA